MTLASRFEMMRLRTGLLMRQTINCLKTEGLGVTIQKSFNVIKGSVSSNGVNLSKWMSTPLYTEEELQKQREKTFNTDITFSIIVPLYNTDEKFLREMIDSVIAQTYKGWELCLADGSDDAHGYVEQVCKEYANNNSRIKYMKLDDNYGIIGNSNKAMDMATGDFISLLDHDDLLHPSALYEAMVAADNGADFIYTDEMSFLSPNVNEVLSIHFKPDFAPDNLRANNYICHFTSFKRSLLNGKEAFREGFEGSQDHDLILRLTHDAKHIAHIPKVLYYWRSHPQSTAFSADSKPYCSISGIRAVTESIKNDGLKGSVDCTTKNPFVYRVKYELNTPLPKVSIVIPNYEHVNDLKTCVTSIKEKTTYPNYEIVIVENNSKNQAIFDYYDEISKDENIKVVRWEGTGFNWAALNNFGICNATGDYILLLNNDTEVITPEWIEEMMMYAQRDDVGMAGAMLYYPNDTIQHAGLIVGEDIIAQALFYRTRRGTNGYMGKLLYAQNMTAVTGACMLFRKIIWEEVGKLDENLAVSYNDVDFCLSVRRAGYLIVWSPYAELYHYEYKSRGLDDTPEKHALTEKEINYFKHKWNNELKAGDPYFNTNCRLINPDYSPNQK